MQVRSLAYRTDLLFARFDGEVCDRGPYLVVASPRNPTFHWGNFLLFAQPPGPADSDPWIETFRREIGSRPSIRHVALGWDGSVDPSAETAPFVARGFDAQLSVVYVATTRSTPPRMNQEVAVRPLATDAEWEAATLLQIALREPSYSLDAYEPFKRAQMNRYRRMAEAGLGDLYGAFLGAEQVANLGLFYDGPVGRFQNVGTLEAFRRRGICSRLVHEAVGLAFARAGVTTLVIVAEDESAGRIYESVGFAARERQVGVSRG